ncbi:concanavalin A-like lectin/glucanase domain-containing protein [Mycena olivaceomarginata]|nr:concanavalin A-like lectin/glucanase domain-containing protein [Mycena olivaceomarginata]
MTRRRQKHRLTAGAMAGGSERPFDPHTRPWPAPPPSTSPRSRPTRPSRRTPPPAAATPPPPCPSRPPPPRRRPSAPAASPSSPRPPRATPSPAPPPPPPSTPPQNPFAGGGTPTQANPFSPPASVRSFSASFDTPVPGMHSPNGHTHAHSGSGSYFATPASTRASSVVELPRTPGSRPGTGTSSLRPNSRPTTAGDGKPGGKREAFASPPARPLTIYAAPSTARLRRERPKSTALLVPSSTVADDDTPKPKPGARPTLKTSLLKPWVGVRDPHSRAAYWITYGMILFGIAAGALCPVMDEDFSSVDTAGLFGTGVAGEGGTWLREVDASGFGNGEFEMTTASDANSFVRDGQLYLVPTLTSDVLPEGSILDGAVYNLTGCTYNLTHSSGYTTSGHGAAGINTTEGTSGGGGIAPDAPLDLPAYLAACSAVSNATEGKILPPVMSARISTRRSASIKFGRVEVRAKLPTGDWLWPAIWMLPVDSVYGGWPLSGEIDIMEARGNGPSYNKQGINYVRSSLNWGPATFLNAVAKTYGWWVRRRGRYDDGFHTYALEWSEDFIRMYVDSRLQYMFETKIKQSFWERGDFPTVVQNGSQSVVLDNPWVNGTKAAPFDQRFYLIMNVAVGGTNGWFPDGPEKPWLDGSGTAPLDFLRAKNQWYNTWPQDEFHRAMVVDSVKMWEKC